MRGVRTVRTMLMLGLVCALAGGAAGAVGQANPGFEKLKGLAGEWDAKTSDGNSTKVTYKVVSGGTALMEQIGEGDMITVYHPDGDAVMLTHYCQANNQPRMRAARLTPDGKTMDFKFVDVTNDANSTMGVMRNVKITFQDADHFTQEWTFAKDGKETPELFSYTRKK